MMGFYDCLLRWQQDSEWCFESLGIEGREHANTAALEYWTSALSAASPRPTEPAQIGPFSLSTDAAYAQDRYLAAVENVISRIDRGRFYQQNLCIRLHAPVKSTAAAVYAQLCDRLQPAWRPDHRAKSSRFVADDLSFSPELFLRIRDRAVLTAPIKALRRGRW
jgi:anthranilate/para-aminobenzoate synthase component I